MDAPHQRHAQARGGRLHHHGGVVEGQAAQGLGRGLAGGLEPGRPQVRVFQDQRQVPHAAVRNRTMPGHEVGTGHRKGDLIEQQLDVQARPVATAEPHGDVDPVGVEVGELAPRPHVHGQLGHDVLQPLEPRREPQLGHRGQHGDDQAGVRLVGRHVGGGAVDDPGGLDIGLRQRQRGVGGHHPHALAPEQLQAVRQFKSPNGLTDGAVCNAKLLTGLTVALQTTGGFQHPKPGKWRGLLGHGSCNPL